MSIEEITVAEARARQQAGAILIDVREPDEHALGVPVSALCVPRAKLEANAYAVVADPAADILLICGSGKRSMLAAQNLAAQGYTRLCSVAGGYQQWQRAGLPVETTQDADYLERYSRHLRLPQVGMEGQEKLARARVLVVGAGGLARMDFRRSHDRAGASSGRCRRCPAPSGHAKPARCGPKR